MRLGLAFRVFFAALFNAVAAKRLQEALAEPPVVTEPKPAPLETKISPPAKSKSRSEALTLLAALQREARFLDIVQEPLSTYSDAQVGAAARDVLRNCAGVLERFFALQPLVRENEGAAMEVPRGYDPQRFRLIGNVVGEPPFHGQLVHHGWLAAKCELPEWSGSSESSRVIAPVEIELGSRA